MNALLITTPTNIRYLTGFVGVEDRDAYLLLTKGEKYLFIKSLYDEQAKQLSLPRRQAGNSQIIQLSNNPISRELVELCKKLKIKKLGFEDTNLTVAELAKLKQVLDDVTMIPTRDRIEKLRQIKRPDEIANIKKACAITDASFDFIITKLKPGVSESEIAWEIETFFRKNNSISAFSPIVAFGKNSSIPHYNSLSNGAKKNQSLALNSDIILLDFGAKYNGYCADMTRVVFIGKPKDEWVRAYETVSEAQKMVLKLLANGERHGATLDTAAKKVIAGNDLLPYPHSLGHSIGLDVHEGPRLNIKKDETLLPGMVFSVEPGIYIPGRYGIRIEDLVRLTHTGIEMLTRSPNDRPNLY